MCMDNLEKGEAVLHIDFSENYNCKLSEEVQSHHFGGSRNQVCLHTGMLHVAEQGNQISFCTISSNLEYGPVAIWAHLEPVPKKKKIKNEYAVKIVHFFLMDPALNTNRKRIFIYLINIYKNISCLEHGTFFKQATIKVLPTV